MSKIKMTSFEKRKFDEQMGIHTIQSSIKTFGFVNVSIKKKRKQKKSTKKTRTETRKNILIII